MQESYEWYPKLFGYTKPALDWAYGTISTRAWDFEHASGLVPLLGETSPHLIPLADMVNHEAGAAVLTKTLKGDFKLVAERALGRGAVVLQSYDPGRVRCDAHWVADYAFVPNRTTFRSPASCMPLGLNLNEGLSAWKADLLADRPVHRATLMGNGLPDAATAQMLRIALAQLPEDVLGEGVEFGTSPEDLAVVTLLKRAAVSMLGRLEAVSVDHDVARLEGSVNGTVTLGAAEVLALTYRVREKLLLELSLETLKRLGKTMYF
eukprot:TRINITY_DN24772_c0_g1_i1.p1 TRINITY_DN24772_c0_g1~~TRINITY_DN24772_c0_g1_i1.p1  ORF type:complete len:264 (-),score=49.88 TRINITY_DN24772_c0_g1_i1:122-913(-)